MIEEQQTQERSGKYKGPNQTGKPQLPSFPFSDIYGVCLHVTACLNASIRVCVCASISVYEGRKEERCAEALLTFDHSHADLIVDLIMYLRRVFLLCF